MKYTIFLYDYCNDDNNMALIIDENQKSLVKEIFDFFDGSQDWGYRIFPNTNKVKDFSALDTSEDKVSGVDLILYRARYSRPVVICGERYFVMQGIVQMEYLG